MLVELLRNSGGMTPDHCRELIASYRKIAEELDMRPVEDCIDLHARADSIFGKLQKEVLWMDFPQQLAAVYFSNFTAIVYKFVYNCSMKESAKDIIAELAAGQWGMFTTAQAQTAGVSRTQVKRMADSGFVEEMRRGVYRQTAGTETPWAQVKAVWLSANPGKTAYERLGASIPDAVVGGQTAACIHGSGELWESPYTLVVPSRRQTRSEDVKYLRRSLREGDFSIIGGLPVASIEETVAELVALRLDPSHVLSFARDVAASGKTIDEGTLAEELDSLARRNAYPNGSAFARAILSGGYDQARAEQVVELAKEIAASGNKKALEDIRKAIG